MKQDNQIKLRRKHLKEEFKAGAIVPIDNGGLTDLFLRSDARKAWDELFEKYRLLLLEGLRL